MLTDRGRMRMTNHPAGYYKPLLPMNPTDEECRGDNRTIFCFRAGEQRSIAVTDFF